MQSGILNTLPLGMNSIVSLRRHGCLAPPGTSDTSTPPGVPGPTVVNVPSGDHGDLLV
jgi:hypothetical protein